MTSRFALEPYTHSRFALWQGARSSELRPKLVAFLHACVKLVNVQEITRSRGQVELRGLGRRLARRTRCRTPLRPACLGRGTAREMTWHREADVECSLLCVTDNRARLCCDEN